jgi:hypothetical protein
MKALWAVVMIVVSFLLVAPVIESGTSGSSHFIAIGNAEGGAGGE